MRQRRLGRKREPAQRACRWRCSWHRIKVCAVGLDVGMLEGVWGLWV